MEEHTFKMRPKNEICRYCLNIRRCKNLHGVYYYRGIKETYTEMLDKTFDVKIPQGTVRQGICESCIKQLRDAASFKNQVLQAEEDLRIQLQFDLASHSKLEDSKQHIEVKVEGGDTDNNDWVRNIDGGQVNPGNILSVKLEQVKPENSFNKEESGHSLNNTKRETYSEKIKKLIEATHNDANQLGFNVKNKKTVNDDDVSEDNDDDEDDDDIEYVVEVKKSLKKVPKGSKRKIVKRKGTPSGINSVKKPRIRKGRRIPSKTERNARENTLKLVLNSNLLLFYTIHLKFRCFSCRESYTDIKDLREHSKMHTNVKYLEKRMSLIRGINYLMADISNLTCKLCEENCTDLKDLTKHLTERHNMEFHDGSNYLIPYRLETDKDNIQCVICDTNFNTLVRLKGHMNRHFTNNVCEVCGISYVNRMSLIQHMKVHMEHKCRSCAIVFNTYYAKAIHIRKFHKPRLPEGYCRKCNKSFADASELAEHKVKEHGAKAVPTASCDKCGKVLKNPICLDIHVRRFHLKEKNFPCGVCEMSFFSKQDKDRHERIHMDIKPLSCELCDVKVKSKESLKRHVKMQHALR